MKLDEIWVMYVNEHLDPNKVNKAPLELKASKSLELLFETHGLFTPRWDGISRTEYNTEFDAEADGALCALAKDNTFKDWDLMSLGSWRVLSERLMYCEVVLSVNIAKGDPIIDHLPHGLSYDCQIRAVLLKYLLGNGRTIDRRLLREQEDKSLPPLASHIPMTRQ